MSDEFFDDEQELMDAALASGEVEPAGDSASVSEDGEQGSDGSAEAAVSAGAAEAEDSPEREASASHAAASSADAEPAPAARRDAPPFWMVLAIAAIALILGVVIGYMLGTSATLAELGNASAQAPQPTQQDAGTQLPQGHPDLDISEDGTATVAGSGSAE